MIIKFFLIIKSCDIYVHVYGQKIYNQIFELNILNWYNIFTSEILKIIFFLIIKSRDFMCMFMVKNFIIKFLN